jgi:hypothetical protein
MSEMCVDVVWVHDPLFAHKGKYGGGFVALRFWPRCLWRARVQERMRVAWQETIVDEEVFLDRELWITTLKVASTIVTYTVAQDQILGARRCANWIGLDKAQALDRAS